MDELTIIIEKFAVSKWDFLATPASNWLVGKIDHDALLRVLLQAKEECGNCGCEFDSLYPKAIELLQKKMDYVMEGIIETKRLVLRKMKQEDIPDLAMMLQDSRVMYAYEHDFSDEDVITWLERQMQRYQEYGFGLFAMVLKETGEMIGQAGLTIQPYRDTEVLEIGYLLKYKHLHNGYASEAANACKEYAFHTLLVKKVYSIIKADNIASKKVAENIGMKKEDSFITQYYHGDMLHDVYAIENMEEDNDI